MRRHTHGKQGMSLGIVGGGIGGLATALFLRRAGFENVTVFEAASELKEIGAGLQIAPNATRLLRRLGIMDRLQDEAVRIEIGWEFRRWEDGRVLFSQELGEECERRFGESYYVVHRAHLLDALRDALPEGVLRLGKSCNGVTQVGDKVELGFEDGSRERVDAVVGSDGIHSVVYGAVLPRRPATFSGLSAYRCLVPAEDAPEMSRRPVTTLWLGPDRHLVHYPVSAGREINLVTANPAEDWRTESWTAEGSVEDLAEEFAGWDERVQRLIASASDTRQYAFYDREPMDRWTAGRIALLGDAAHPMMPFFAQGATQAIEDAAVLAGCLGESAREGIPEALKRYESLRKERASTVQRMSRARREHHHMHDGPEQKARDAKFAEEDPLGHNSWLYGHDVEAELVSNVAGGA